MEHIENHESPERPAGPQGLKQPSGASPTEAPARSAAKREDFAPADAGAEHKNSPENKYSFTPVPRLKDRSNGWKPHIQQRFIAALAETGSVAAACRRVGRTDHGAYCLRRHPEAESFRAAWDAALDLGVRRIEDAAMDRALYGTEEVVVQNGETVITRRRYNERLVMFLLRNRAPHRFAEGGARSLSAMDKMQLKRLKEQWRAEWEREEAEADDAAPAEIDAMLDAMRREWVTGMSPAQREAQILADAQARADRAAGWQPGTPYEAYSEEAKRLLPQFIEDLRTGGWDNGEAEGGKP